MAFSTGNPVDIPALQPDAFLFNELSDTERGLAWFKLTFGMLCVAVSVPILGRLIYVRNVFEIRARSAYLVLIAGVSLIVVLSLTTYFAAFRIYPTIPFNVEAVYIVLVVAGFSLSGSFWTRILRLGVAYCPRVKKRLPWIMSERLLVVVALSIGLASTAFPFYYIYSIDGPFAVLEFANTMIDKIFNVQVIQLVATVVLAVPMLWRVDDLFKISAEIIAVTIVQTVQVCGNALAREYGHVEFNYWLNQQNTAFVGSIILFSVVVVDPLRRLTFNPLSKTYPAVARAQERRRERGLRALKLGPTSNTTDPDSMLESVDSQSASANEMQTPRRRKWSYESLAVVPALASSFRQFAFRALCQESVIFLEEITRYQNGEFSMCRGEERSDKAAFLTMVNRFIVDGSVDEVNISGVDKKKILELSHNNGERFVLLNEQEKRNVFGEAYVEIRYMLETNLLQRFTETQEFKDKELAVPPPPARHRNRRRVNNFDDEVDEEQPQQQQSGISLAM